MDNFWISLPRPILALAPMVGVTDSAFRQLAKQWGADVVYSEMISADALVHHAEKAHAMMDHVACEQPLVIQLMGNKPEVLAEAARMANARGASGIDINFGCPARKIARNFCGVMLMRDFDLSRRLIEAVLTAVKLPVSIKVRVSIRKNPASPACGYITIHDFLGKIADLPVAAVMVHGRSFEDSFDGGIRAEMIAEAKKIFTSGPVLANGGVTDVESARALLQSTGADGLGLARSAIGRPWIFKQIRDFLMTGRYDDMQWQGIKETILQHAQLFDQYRGSIPFRDLRRHLTHYVRSREQASELRRRLVQVNASREVASILSGY